MVQYISGSQSSYTLAEREEFFRRVRLPEHTPHVFLQTCDRIELYWGEGAVPAPVAEHLFKVVSGLDSSLVGECAIQGQVKQAYLEACTKYRLSAGLHKLFQTALSVGKRVRTESAISQGAISHSQAVIECLTKQQVPLKNALITLLGVNKLNEDVIKFLQNKGAQSIVLGNRNYEKACELAAQYQCEAFRLDNIKQFLEFTDVLITATSAPHLIIKPEHIPTNKALIILDLAFPRDVDERVGLLPNVQLYNLEDIKALINQNLEDRRVKLVKALEIVEEEVGKLKLNAPTTNTVQKSHPLGIY